ncbi:MAG: glycosyltransferase family 9 protein [Jatrophihabitantaceae bacterium]
MPTALILRALGLGDFVTGLPAMRLLRQALPRHRLILAAPAVFQPLLELGVPADELLPTGELAPIDTGPIGTGQPIEVAVDLHGNGPASRRLLHELRPSRVVGFGHPASGLPGPPWWAAEHEITRWERLVAQGFGLDPAAVTGQPGRLAVPAEPVPRQVTVLHPGAAANSRRWPVERFAAVADRLSRQGHRVVLTGSPAEQPLLAQLGRATGARPLTGLSLRQLFGLVAGARLVVCGDTGIAHVASLYRTPSVVLFGPVAPERWGPPASGPHRVLWHGDGTGDPHGDEPDPALLRITVPQVLAAIAQLEEHDSDRQRVGGL